LYLDPDDFREGSENTWTRGCRLTDAEAPEAELVEAIEGYSRLFDRETLRDPGHWELDWPVPGLVQRAVALLVANHFHEWNPDARRSQTVRLPDVEYEMAGTSPTGLPEVDAIVRMYRDGGGEDSLVSVRLMGDYDPLTLEDFQVEGG
jgi:hypothetical protein